MHAEIARPPITKAEETINTSCKENPRKPPTGSAYNVKEPKASNRTVVDFILLRFILETSMFYNNQINSLR